MHWRLVAIEMVKVSIRGETIFLAVLVEVGGRERQEVGVLGDHLRSDNVGICRLSERVTNCKVVTSGCF